MSGKRRHDEREAHRKASAERAKGEALERGLAVDLSALALHGSYSQPDFVERGYYVDRPFACKSCGISQVWSASQQKWWYEVAQGDVFSTAVLRRPCRRRERDEREKARHRVGDPNPYKNPGLLLAGIRSELEPAMLTAGYVLIGAVLGGFSSWITAVRTACSPFRGISITRDCPQS
ncbi:zinc-ribbon domain containing protein [Planctomyces sp. SH-PL62]|uniref:zinc-ribbon domain containing protein n=1 Tax=Planctomyces sp. SH-PL62 TaxID=1636152 RepID=UPI0009EDCB85|nr:zinc-ribbon domain containing protein [Planctomyces sp. SH-PL62]